MTRLQQLFEFLKQDPDDAFTLYAIAMEYTGVDGQRARHYYEQLLREHPDYVATYYHAAKLYADLDLPEEAERTYQAGLQVALRGQKSHAYRELQRAYLAFLHEEEEE